MVGRKYASYTRRINQPPERCCGTCRWWQGKPEDEVCVNDESEYLADWTEPGDRCEEWMSKERMWNDGI